jgi:WD40 repeat protein
LTPDGRYALTGGTDQTMRLWDSRTGRELYCYRGHGAMVTGVAFAPDLQRICSASHDRTARIWEIPRDKLPPR